MDVKKRILELTTQMSEINYDSEEDNLIKDSVTDVETGTNNLKNVENDDFELVDIKSNLRKINADTLIDNLYEGKPVSRKIENLNDFKTDPESDLDSESNVQGSSGDDTEDMGEEEDDDDNDNESIDSEELNQSSESLEKKSSNKDVERKEDYNIYSSGVRSVKEDIAKGIAIRNQLGLWESLLECRIKLQKSLVACNKLPQKNNFVELSNLTTADNKQMIEKTNKSVVSLLGKLTDLQSKLLSQCTEYKAKSSITVDGNISDEEIASDSDSENGDDEEKEEPARKKIKLHEYTQVLYNKYQEYIPYRNMSIQKWNDKTKIASGKMANSNFSAFDQSTLKQIEQIMMDKGRLINRTQIKRSRYRVLGTEITETKDTSQQETEADVEIFDDDDFYHKLLRDFIERRSVDGSNSTQSERQWIELQKLRSKMKKKVDTKSTKGRRIRHVVLPKLVNFMAPISYNTWNENAESELYNSLFGKITSR